MNIRVGRSKALVFVWVIAMCACVFLFCEKAMATYPFSTYQGCLDTSGGNEHILDVQNVCAEAIRGEGGAGINDSYNYCSLWIGDRANVGVIKVDQPSGKITLYYYGMCVVTSGAYNCEDPLPGSCASFKIAKMDLEGDNDSIGVATDWTRGVWGSPNTKETKLDVAKFISGVTATSCLDGKYNCYKRVVTIKRTNPRTPDSWYSQVQTIEVAVKRPDKTLTLKSCDSNGNSLAGVSGLGDSSKTVEYGETASLPRGLSINNGYTASTFKGFVVSATSCADTKGKSKVASDSPSDPYYVSGDSSEIINVKQLTENGTVYAIYELPNLTLTRHSVDKLGNSLDGVIPAVTVTKEYGQSARVCRPDSEPASLNYKFWAASVKKAQDGEAMGERDGVTSDEKCYEIPSITKSKEVFVVYDVNFEGKSNVVGTNVMNWRSTDGYARVELSNCSSTNGCKVKFVHSLRQSVKYGSTSWNIVRQSNYWDGEFGGENGVEVKRGTFDSTKTTTADGSQDIYTSREYKLKPGMYVCEKMSFKKTIASSDVVRTTICATATGVTQPGDLALLDIDVRNENVNSYSEYGDGPVYAKPGDTVWFQAAYEPRLQYAFNVVPGAMQINSGALIENNGNTLQVLFNANKGSLNDWNNAFSIDCENFECNLASNIFTIGDSTRQLSTNNRKITSGDVGKKLSEKALTNARNNTKTTPSQVTFYESDNKNVANVSTTSIEDTASVIVPYNFTTSTYIKTTSGEVVYAGETTSISYAIAVGEKRNNLTGGSEYATKVPSAKTKIEVSLDGGVSWISSDEETISGQNLNPSGGAGEVKTFNKTVNVPDVSAGSRFCARTAVWPQNSGADDNINPANFGGIATSEPVCFVVAKKPSFQVWGGEVFINGNTTVPISQKRNLNSDYTITGGSEKYTFGSWTELGLIGNKTIKGIASGASLGYSGAGLSAEPGGEKDSTNCKRSVLSFANKQCASSVGNISSTGLFDVALLDSLSGMVKKIVPDMKEVNVSGNINLGSDYAIDATNGVRYSYAGNHDLSVGGSSITEIAGGVTHVVYSDKTVKIDGNIIYTPGAYTNLTEVPKLLIYGSNIYISCNVNRIDAVLMTKGAVNTCYDSNDINSVANSNQLRINGVIMAKSLRLMRTYGAGTGNNSIVPAEIINYDSSMYLWAMRDFSTMSETMSTDGEIVEVFKRELAPRY